MIAIVHILLAAVLTGSLSLLLGNTVLRMLRVDLRRCEAMFLSFVLGAGCLAGLVYAMAAAGLARKGAFFIMAAVLLAAMVWRGGHRFPQRGDERVPVTFWVLYLLFGAVYLSVALAPEASLDGSSYYLADGARRSSGGVEMLFVFGFEIAKHSAAAMVELLFLLALPWGMLAYAQRIENSRAGVLGALLFFLSPIAARTGTIAAPDVAIACIVFALFLTLERRLLIPAALLFGFLAWTATPWLLREFAKPILHLNGWYGRLPLDLAVHGQRLDGLLGPVFLMTPLALLALRYKAGRHLLGWGLMAATPCLGAMEARAVIAAVPFVALALAMVLVEWRMAAPATLAAHAIMSWPAFLPLYTDEHSWRLRGSEWAPALRIESQDSYLMRTLPGYHLARVLDTTLPSGARIFAMHPFPSAYSRPMMEGALGDALLSALLPERLPVRIHELRFPEQAVSRLRVTPEPFGGEGRWGIYEIHLYRGETEIQKTPMWRAEASPRPAEAAWALDGNPVTRWTSGRVSSASMHFTLDLGAPTNVDRVVLLYGADQAHEARLEGIAATTSSRDLGQPPDGLRAEAAAALKQAGVGWLIVSTSEARFLDLVDRAPEWGLSLLAFEDGYAAFRVE